MDALGDYILFRNYLELLKNSSPKDIEIHFLGHISNQKISEILDSSFVKSFFWIDKHKFVLRGTYRDEVIKKFEDISYKTIYNCSFSRDFFSDFLIAQISANNKIAFNGDLNNAYRFQLSITNIVYSKLVDTAFKFEYFKYQDLFNLKHVPIKICYNFPCNEQQKFVLINVSASHPSRIWSSGKYTKVIKFLLQTTNYNILLSGLNTEMGLASNIIENCKSERLKNLVGKLDIVKLFGLIQNSILFITPDTGTLHVAAAIHVNYICISNGNHYLRFHPYPKELNKTGYFIYPTQMYNDKYFKNKEKKTTKPLNQISSKEVNEKILEIINN